MLFVLFVGDVLISIKVGVDISDFSSWLYCVGIEMFG